MLYRDRLRKDRAKRSLDAAIHQTLAAIGRNLGVKQAFIRLLLHVQGCADLLRRTPLGGYPSCAQAEHFLPGLLALSHHHADWLREIEAWKPTDTSPSRQFGSLARHLLANCPVPTFMDRVWFQEPSKISRQQQKWFKHLGLGYGIRGTDIPIRLTKKMAYLFTLAPDHYTVEQALRWGQIRGWGGGKPLVDAVVSTRLGRTFEHEAYWAQAIRFLVCNQEAVLPHVAAIVEYLRVHRHHLPTKKLDWKVICCLLEKVAQIQAPAVADDRVRSLAWAPIGIDGFTWQEDADQNWTWTISELLTSSELSAEGAAMRHCVASYASRCAEQKSSIWSMICHSHRGHQRVLTIEVNPATRAIVQARGRGNKRPSRQARRVMEDWAEKERLKLGDI